MFHFNIRVYGILQDSNNRVLVSDEFIRGEYYTKFPGGGLEFGEGTRDCLAREFMEETSLTVSVGEHIYTTDHFQLSAFNKEHQIISIYYFVHTSEPVALETKTKIFDFSPAQVADNTTQCELFRWVAWDELAAETVTLPLDKIVVNILKEKHGDKPQDTTMLVRGFQ